MPWSVSKQEVLSSNPAQDQHFSKIIFKKKLSNEGSHAHISVKQHLVDFNQNPLSYYDKSILEVL